MAILKSALQASYSSDHFKCDFYFQAYEKMLYNHQIFKAAIWIFWE